MENYFVNDATISFIYGGTGFIGKVLAVYADGVVMIELANGVLRVFRMDAMKELCRHA